MSRSSRWGGGAVESALVVGDEVLLNADDEQMRGVGNPGRAGLIIERAAARGTRYVMVDASDDSAPILRRLGFRAVTTTTPYVWTPQTSG